MSSFNLLTTIEGVNAQVNYDNIIYILPNDDHSSLIMFRDGQSLLVKQKMSLKWPMGNEDLLYDLKPQCKWPSFKSPGDK